MEPWDLRSVHVLSLNHRVISPQGDAILQCEHIFEVVTKLAMLAKKEHTVSIVHGRWVASGWDLTEVSDAISMGSNCLPSQSRSLPQGIGRL